ncbi:hypothetical protein BS47DRAFT_1325191 [Hydnum rufescens UP504]|uniref:NADP-dependent oxidoreductase domain-containing protein n=1 Tax=Hydnum rufescens UP504 TaxID=1448309 RepID=A0A9P6B752_9AGAM|nr:hypothetical protein BS47DRAFT_1325191 [Hydnum rufescens UP504]
MTPRYASHCFCLHHEPTAILQGMLFRRLGTSGLQVPIISLGGWLTYGRTVNGDLVKDIIKYAFEAGINYFDTGFYLYVLAYLLSTKSPFTLAEAYANGRSEIEMGRVFRDLGIRRSDLIISTKVFFGTGGKSPNDRGLSRKHVIEGTLQSLERLQMDYGMSRTPMSCANTDLSLVDILFAHRPDPNTPMLEIVRAFNWLIDQGKTLYWGTSEWSAAQIQEAFDVAEKHNLHAPVAEQPLYNALQQHRFKKDLVPIFEKYGYGTTIYSPLASSLLAGKYNNGIPPDSRYAKNADISYIKALVDKLDSPEGKAQIGKVQALEAVAKDNFKGVTTAQLALAWVLKNPRVSTMITGATSTEQLLENLNALQVLPNLTEEIYNQINEIFDA